MRTTFSAPGNRLASLGQRVVVIVDSGLGAVTLRAPLYRSTIKFQDIVSARASQDDGSNHGFLNWYVSGRADSPNGIRLNTGGKGRVDIRTRDGRRYAVVMDSLEQAQEIAALLQPGE